MRGTQRDTICSFIETYIAAHGYGPSVREIGEAVGLRSTATVQYHLRALAEAGRIVMEPGKKRAISLPAEGGRADRESRTEAPLVPILGAVAAGRPIPAAEHVEGWLPWEGGEGWFALRVRGDSMKNAGIFSGDTVVVRPQPTAEHGEIVVALLGDEATVKRLFRRDGQLWLLPENEAYEPIDGSEAAILGVVRGLIRNYG